MCSKRCWLASWSVDTSVLVGLSVAHATSLVVVAAAVNTVDVKKNKLPVVRDLRDCARRRSSADDAGGPMALKLCRRVVPSITPAASLASGRIGRRPNTHHSQHTSPELAWVRNFGLRPSPVPSSLYHPPTANVPTLPGHLPGRPPAHQTTYDDNRRPVG